MHCRGALFAELSTNLQIFRGAKSSTTLVLTTA